MAQPPKVLIVDDEPGIQRMYDRYLAKKGVTLLPALITDSAYTWLESVPDIAVAVFDGEIPGTQSTPDLARMVKQRLTACLTIGASGNPDLQARLAAVCDFTCQKVDGPWLVAALLLKLGYSLTP